MVHIPLFPLNTVLFPGMPLKLHIFEERYKMMINTCLDEQKPFGVVLIESGVEVGAGQAQPHAIGCTASITQVQRLSSGRMNILTTGRERFRIRSLNYDKPYLSGEVEMYPLRDTSPAATIKAGKKLHDLVFQYLKALEHAGQIQMDNNPIPADPIALAHLAAVILPIENHRKQALLAASDTRHLMRELLSIYTLETALVERMKIQATQAEQRDDSLPFSLN